MLSTHIHSTYKAGMAAVGVSAVAVAEPIGGNTLSLRQTSCGSAAVNGYDVDDKNITYAARHSKLGPKAAFWSWACPFLCVLGELS